MTLFTFGFSLNFIDFPIRPLQYSDNKSYCEDLSEGKFSFPIIHAIQSHPEDKQVVSKYTFVQIIGYTTNNFIHTIILFVSCSTDIFYIGKPFGLSLLSSIFCLSRAFSSPMSLCLSTTSSMSWEYSLILA